MKPSTSSNPARRRQRGGASVELALIISVSILLAPAVALFAKVFFQYSVVKEATRDAAAYMASLPPAAIRDEGERNRAMALAQRMVSDATAGAGMSGSTLVGAADIKCDNHTCLGLVPDSFDVEVTFAINDAAFNALTGAWTDHETKTWEVTARSTYPVSR